MPAIEDAIEALYNVYLTDAALLPDAETRLDVVMMVEQWKGAQIATAALQADRLQSYSMGGNSYTRRNIADLAGTTAALKQSITDALYGGRSRLVDNRFEAML